MRASFHNNETLIQHPNLPSEFAIGIQSHTLYYLKACALDYDDSYFLSEYESQYGCTYLEDENNLRIMARQRLAHIQKYKPPPGNLLEIGSATGFFLDEARTLGYEVEGYEISEFAANYARNNLELSIRSSSIFENNALQFNHYDVICAYYTIEHFPDQVRIFNIIQQALRKKGVFSFALPSSNGPALEFNSHAWARSHPIDHYVDYNPQSIKKVLSQYGMQLRNIYPASFHQRRCRGIKAWLPEVLYRMYARIFTYGDTMEGLAQSIV